MTDTIDWPGKSGSYRYWFLATPVTAANIQATAGNYMFVRPVTAGWVPVYIGIAENLQDRLPNHERWAEAVKLGATRVMGHTQADAAKRKAEEKDLISHWNPALNTQHSGAARVLGY